MFIFKVFREYLCHIGHVIVMFDIILFSNTLSTCWLQTEISKLFNLFTRAIKHYCSGSLDQSGLYVLTAKECQEHGLPSDTNTDKHVDGHMVQETNSQQPLHQQNSSLLCVFKNTLKRIISVNSQLE